MSSSSSSSRGMSFRKYAEKMEKEAWMRAKEEGKRMLSRSKSKKRSASRPRRKMASRSRSSSRSRSKSPSRARSRGRGRRMMKKKHSGGSGDLAGKGFDNSQSELTRAYADAKKNNFSKIQGLTEEITQLEIKRNLLNKEIQSLVAYTESKLRELAANAELAKVSTGEAEQLTLKRIEELNTQIPLKTAELENKREEYVQTEINLRSKVAQKNAAIAESRLLAQQYQIGARQNIYALQKPIYYTGFNPNLNVR